MCVPFKFFLHDFLSRSGLLQIWSKNSPGLRITKPWSLVISYFGPGKNTPKTSDQAIKTRMAFIILIPVSYVGIYVQGEYIPTVIDKLVFIFFANITNCGIWCMMVLSQLQYGFGSGFWMLNLQLHTRFNFVDHSCSQQRPDSAGWWFWMILGWQPSAKQTRKWWYKGKHGMQT